MSNLQKAQRMTTEFKRIITEKKIGDSEIQDAFGISERTLRRLKSGQKQATKQDIFTVRNIELYRQETFK
jgi:hypothetical protein